MYGDEIAYIVSDFHYQCSKPLYSSGGDFYTAHFWLGILFVLLYPIGIPTLCGTVIFLHRADIKDGAGPSAFKRLYEDYKPDHCLCVATANSHHTVTFQRICTHAAVVAASFQIVDTHSYLHALEQVGDLSASAEGHALRSPRLRRAGHAHAGIPRPRGLRNRALGVHAVRTHLVVFVQILHTMSLS